MWFLAFFALVNFCCNSYISYMYIHKREQLMQDWSENVQRLPHPVIIFNYNSPKIIKAIRCFHNTIRFCSGFTTWDKSRPSCLATAYQSEHYFVTNFYFRVELSHLFTLQAESRLIFLFFLEDCWIRCSQATIPPVSNVTINQKWFFKQDLFLPFCFDI